MNKKLIAISIVSFLATNSFAQTTNIGNVINDGYFTIHPSKTSVSRSSSYRYFNVIDNSNNSLFSIDRNATIRATGDFTTTGDIESEDVKCNIIRTTTLVAGPSQTANLEISYNKDGYFLLNSHLYGVSAGTTYTPLHFNALGYQFDGGDMVVNGSITCKTKLDVCEVKATKINVELPDAADYVFEENYNLQPLSEVEDYVKANKHLPGVPSAAEFSENGMNVSEMSNLLLQKVEELTLHMIELEKENKELKSEIENLKK